VAVAAAPDGTWVEIAALTSHQVNRLEDALPWISGHWRHLAERAAGWHGPRYRESEFEFLPPIPRPAAFRDFDAFERHVQAARSRLGLPVPEAWYEAPFFHFANRLALVGHGAKVCAPAGSNELDFGLSLGVVIGHRGRDIPVEKAWEHVAGFTVVNDLSARDLEQRSLPAGLGPSKGKDFAMAAGPWLVLKRKLEAHIEGEQLSLEMAASLNGRELVRGSTRSLYHSIPRMIAHASRDAELFPGDLLNTGAVGGGSLLEQGADGNGGWLKPGDLVELSIEGIGSLATHIVARSKSGEENREIGKSGNRETRSSVL
jgi:fumarylacetoacetate (FAA) hydrolase